MLVIPAVDIRGGRAVRLRSGRADAETVFADDPVAAAERWARAGCERLHVVDLDGAFGQARQIPVIAEIIRTVAPVPVEVGGGLRDLAAVESVLAAGARWAVVGTRAALDPEFLRAVGRAFGERLIVAVDARGSRVAVKGWTEVIEETVADVGRRARDAGAGELLYTDATRDGMETGPNVEDTAALARTVAMPILASGGVATVGDLVRLAAIDGVRGTVVGRALYTGAIDLRAAIEQLAVAAASASARGAAGSSAGSAGATPNVRAVGGVGGSGARSPRP